MIIVPGAGVGLHGDGGNNEVATFTDDRTIQGEAEFTFDGSTLDLDGALVVDGSNISLDSTSTLNIDNSNTSNGIGIGTNSSGTPISIGHSTSEVTINDNLGVTGTTQFSDDVTIIGTTPLLTIGDNADEDTGLIFAGHDGSSAVNYHMGFDAGDNSFVIGTGTAIGAGGTRMLAMLNSNIVLGHPAEVAPLDYYQVLIRGDWTSGGSYNRAATLSVGSDLTGHSGDDAFLAHALIGTGAGGSITTAGNVDGTPGVIASLYLTEPDISTAHTVDNSATLYIEAAASEATNDYALFVDSGVSRFDGQVLVGTSATGFNTDYDDLIVGSGSGNTGMFIYSGNTSVGALQFHDAANTSLSGFVSYDHNINMMYFGTQGLGRFSMSGGNSPIFRIGLGQTYDAMLRFDGNEVDFHVGLEDNTNRLVIGTGTTLGTNTAMRISSTGNTTFDGNVNLESSTDSNPILTLKNSNANANPAYFDIWKLGGSPADDDYLGIQRWIGKNTADEDIVYATMFGTSLDVTDSTEDGGITFQAMREGTNRTTLQVAWGGVYLYHTGNIVAQTGSEGLWIGDGGTEDQTIVWNGNAQDYYWGIDDTDDSFRLGLGSTAGTNTVISISTAGITYFTDTSGIYIKDDVPLFFGTGADYKMEYEPSNTRFVLWTNDTNGSDANEDLIRIEDGQKTIDANTTWDDNAFDIYDDAMLLASSISPTADAYNFGKGVFKRGKDALIEAGVLKRYEDDGWIGYNDQRMAALLAGGIYQTRQLVDEMKEEINKLRKQVTALGG
jgi:hypothetical protein